MRRALRTARPATIGPAAWMRYERRTKRCGCILRSAAGRL